MRNEGLSNILRVLDYWINLFKTWKVLESDCVIVASDDKYVMSIVANNLSLLKIAGEIYVIGSGQAIDDEIKKNTDIEYTFIAASHEMISELNKIPSIYYIFDSIYRCSFDGEDIDGYKLVGIEGITVEDIVRYGVLRLGKDSLESNDLSGVLNKRFEAFKTELPNILNVGKKVSQYVYSNNYRKNIFISPLPGTGDIYLLSTYLHEYIRVNGINEYLLYVTNDHLRKIAELMEIKTSVIDKDSMKAFYTWRRINDSQQDNIKILDQNIYQRQTNLLQAVPGNNYNLMISRLIFNDIKIDNSKRYLVNKNCDKEKYGLQSGKSVLIAPYAHTIAGVELSFWQGLVNEFLKKHYKVFINADTNDNAIISGVTPIFIPYEELDDFCKNCVAVIGLRSGLFDIISKVECKLVVLYKGKLYNSSNDTINFFGLKNMGLREKDLLEIKYDDIKEKQEHIIQEIFDYVMR